MLLKRGEKIEPITQVKGLGIIRRRQTSSVKERRKKLDIIICRLSGKGVYLVWRERRQDSRTLEVWLWLRGCHVGM